MISDKNGAQHKPFLNFMAANNTLMCRLALTEADSKDTDYYFG